MFPSRYLVKNQTTKQGRKYTQLTFMNRTYLQGMVWNKNIIESFLTYLSLNVEDLCLGMFDPFWPRKGFKLWRLCFKCPSRSTIQPYSTYRQFSLLKGNRTRAKYLQLNQLTLKNLTVLLNLISIWLRGASLMHRKLFSSA